MNINKIYSISYKNPAKSRKASTQSFSGTKPIEIKGKETKAKIFASDLTYPIYERVKILCNHPALRNRPIRLMPDVHPSKTTLVGLTVKNNPNNAIPGIISGDIGCGVLCVGLDGVDKEIDYRNLDNVIKTRISGKKTNEPSCKEGFLRALSPEIATLTRKYKITPEEIIEKLGTLGGGNHFIEIDKDTKGNHYLVIHSGSRSLGNAIYRHFDKIAQSQNPYRIRGLSYLNPDESLEYMRDMEKGMKFAKANRRIIANEILRQMGWREKSSFEAVHNYIDKDGFIRKGAISAKSQEPVIIPLNMRDGAIIGRGKGNQDWNNSAPHGAGRPFSRSDASKFIPLEAYKKSMDGIYSSNISESTIDESPFAYKPPSAIIGNVKDSIEIDEQIKPEYNYKD